MSEKYATTHIAAGVVIKQNGKYLLVQEKMPSQYGLWNWPAGKVDKGETIEQAAVREAYEESGFKVKLIRKLGIWQESAEKAVQHAFEAEIVGGELNYPPDELLDARWFTNEEINAMKDKLRAEWILAAITIMESGSDKK